MATSSVLMVCAVVVFALATATPMADSASGDGGFFGLRRQRAADAATTPTPPAERVYDGVQNDDDDLGRKKKIKKNNSTLGAEVISAIVDGLSGESEDAKFGSEIRKEFGYLVQAVTNLSATAIDKLVSTRAVGQPAVLPCEQCEEEAEDHVGRAARAVDNVGDDVDWTARAVNNVGEGRRRQVRRLLVRYLVLLKVFALGIILPGAVLLSLLQSWKAVTLSLMALLLAGVIGIRGLVSTAAKGQAAEVIHTTGPGGHYWRRVSSPEAGQDPDRLAYSAFVPVS